MDPLSATASVAGIIAFCLKTAKGLESLRESYKHASGTIAALCSEASVISASLAQVQGILLRNSQVSRDEYRIRPELQDAFDIALTGCAVTFSCLDHEVQSLVREADEDNGFGWKTKAKCVWKEEAMGDLLLQIRGQQTAISLLMQGLQMESLSDIQQLLRGNSTLLDKIVSGTRSNRSLNPSLKVPESVLGIERELDSLFGDHTSTISGTEFDFDDMIVNSRAYRRTLNIAKQRISRIQREPAPIEGDLIDLSSNTDQNKTNGSEDSDIGDSAQRLGTLPSICSSTDQSNLTQTSDHVAFMEPPSLNSNDGDVRSQKLQGSIHAACPVKSLSQRDGLLHRDVALRRGRFGRGTSSLTRLQNAVSPASWRITSTEPPQIKHQEDALPSNQTLPGGVRDSDRDSWPLRSSDAACRELTHTSDLPGGNGREPLQVKQIERTEFEDSTALSERSNFSLSPMSYQSLSRSGNSKFSDSGFYSQVIDQSISIHCANDQARPDLCETSRRQRVPEVAEVHLKRLSGLSRLPDIRDDHYALPTIWTEIFRKQSSNLLDLADLITNFGGLLNIESYNGRESLKARERELFVGIQKLEGLSQAFRGEFEPFRQSQKLAMIFDDDRPF